MVRTLRSMSPMALGCAVLLGGGCSSSTKAPLSSGTGGSLGSGGTNPAVTDGGSGPAGAAAGARPVVAEAASHRPAAVVSPAEESAPGPPARLDRAVRRDRSGAQPRGAGLGRARAALGAAPAEAAVIAAQAASDRPRSLANSSPRIFARARRPASRPRALEIVANSSNRSSAAASRARSTSQPVCSTRKLRRWPALACFRMAT